MDKETLNRVLNDLKNLKETIFEIWIKIEKAKELSIGERMNLERQIKMSLQKLEETEYQIFKVLTQEKQQKEDIYTLTDRAILTVHDLVDTLDTIINVDSLCDIHHYILEVEEELDKKGVK